MPPLTEKQKADRAVLRIGKDPHKLRPEARMRIETPDAESRMRIVEMLNELAADREAAVQPSSRIVFWRECQRKFGIPAAMLKRISSTDEISKLEKWLAMEDKQQSNRGRKRFWAHSMSKDQGIRLGKDGKEKKTFVSPFEAEELQLKSWIRREEEHGHDLEVTDLVAEFILILESQVCDMEEKKWALGGLPKADEKKNERCATNDYPNSKHHTTRDIWAHAFYTLAILCHAALAMWSPSPLQRTIAFASFRGRAGIG